MSDVKGNKIQLNNKIVKLCVFHTLNQHKQLNQLRGVLSIRPPSPAGHCQTSLELILAYFEDPGILSFRICGLLPCTQETQNTTC